MMDHVTAASNWAQHYDDVVDRHGPLLTAAVGRRLTGVWTPPHGRLSRHSPRTWSSRAPMLLAFEGLRLECAWHTDSRSITSADVGVECGGVERTGGGLGMGGGMGVGVEHWYRLGDDEHDPAELVSLTGQRLWAVDVLEADCDQTDLGFAFSRSYVTMTSACCCTSVLGCGPQQKRRLRLAQTGPTREGHPPRAVTAPRNRPAWPPSGADPSLVPSGRTTDSAECGPCDAH